jgi:hypothetical protein
MYLPKEEKTKQSTVKEIKYKTVYRFKNSFKKIKTVLKYRLASIYSENGQNHSWTQKRHLKMT